ncbi:MAG: membrane protein insertase YidC [Gemmatimonadota bacterium]
MDSGRFVLAVILMIAVMVVTNILFAPDPVPRPDAVSDSVVVVDSAPVALDTALPTEPAAETESPLTGLPAESAAAPAGQLPTTADPATPGAAVLGDTVWVESPLYRYGFSTRGAGLLSLQVLGHNDYSEDLEEEERPPVELVPEGRTLVRPRMRVGEQVLDLAALEFQVEPAGGLQLGEGAGPDTLRFTWNGPDGRAQLVLGYAFRSSEYVVDSWVYLTGVGDVPQRLLLDLGPTLASNEANPDEDIRERAMVVNGSREGIQSTPLRSVDEATVREGPFHWVALRSKYFVVAVLRGQDGTVPLSSVEVTPGDSAATANLTAYLNRGSDRAAFSYRLYLGPQDPGRLAAVGYDFGDVNQLGWRFLRPIIQPVARFVTWALLEMHNVLGLGYGWVLILFGVLIRVVLWPLNAKAARSQLKTMELQPRIKEIQTKHKGNPEQTQKEMMRLYKEEGFNPMGGCLPVLIPFPVLIALFFVFQATIEFRGVDFLWLPDLSRPDPYYLLPVLLGVSMFLMQWVMRPVAGDNPQMKMMMYFMPIFMTVIFLNFASGLNLYYATMNLASIPQQILTVRERKRTLENRK